MGKKFIRLDCMAENPALCAYYEQVGFTHRGETQGKGWKAALYEKKVPIV
jgi:RimJ/RimL family protein N-acetyltransferase